MLSKEGEVGLENKYSVQFMSLKSSHKSLLASNRLEKKLKDDDFDLKLIVICSPNIFLTASSIIFVGNLIRKFNM